jgi:hypothetical protein
MADQRRVHCVWLALIQQGFKPPGGSIEEKGFDSVGHISFLSQPSAVSTQPLAFSQEALTATDAKAAKEWSQSSIPFAYFAPLAVKSIFALLRVSVPSW